ncbi:signal transduction histidine kinase [Oikeobacillus pervagus]|uniref:histidine kinase n=1 Tax=Oikeobacillus pervagus TaxID=1325931 RepID=A0AAJ1WKC3_9BACI|nr:HAMP domain-containing sensor histidine kinase [Oikeobacillus pervagus]MDQ0216448.1 signal transduction histidine kinase [Oikeobacillus pervagus]
MKLQTKINLYTTVTFICLLILINGAIYFSFSRMILHSELERVVAEAEKTVMGMNQTGGSIPARDLLRAYIPVNGMLQLVKSNGETGTAITVPGQEKLLEQPVTFYAKEWSEIIDYKGMPHAFVSIPIIGGNGEIANVQLTENLTPTAHILQILKYVLIAVTILAAIPVFLSTRLLSNFITRPITSMIQTMKDIRKNGQYKHISLPKQSKDELYQMGETFNDMMEQLKINYEKQEQFVSNASHELKTPLTVIEGYASLLKRRGRDHPELFDESVEAIHSEAIRMKELTQQLLLLAKHDEQWDVDLQIVSLTDLVEESIRSFKAGYKREVNVFVEQKMKVKTDPQKLKQLLYILLDNARKYSEDLIKVNIMTIKNRAVIEVVDRGIGIPVKEQSKVFDRFFRVDKVRTGKNGGFGLGLPLAKELADAIDAKICLSSVEGEGTTVQIWFKKGPSH